MFSLNIKRVIESWQSEYIEAIREVLFTLALLQLFRFYGKNQELFRFLFSNGLLRNSNFSMTRSETQKSFSKFFFLVNYFGIIIRKNFIEY